MEAFSRTAAMMSVKSRRSDGSPLAVTTNGYRLARDVKQWRDAGLTALNVSVDSLDARQFHAITGQDKFHQVMSGIDAALDAGFRQLLRSRISTLLTLTWRKPASRAASIPLIT